MTKIVALFDSQDDMTRALDQMSGWGVETTVLDVANDVDLLGEGGSIAAAPPSVSSAAAPNLYPVGPYNPFADVDLGNLDDEAEQYLLERVQRGAKIVVAEGDDDMMNRVQTLLQQRGGKVYEAS